MEENNPLTSMTLIQAAVLRNPESWERFLALYHPLARTWCEKRGLRGADLEDVCQDVFVGALVGISKYRPDGKTGSFRRWLWGVTDKRIQRFYSNRGGRPTALGGSEAKDMIEAFRDPFALDMNACDESESSISEVRQLYLRAIDIVRNDFEEKTWTCFSETVIQGKSNGEVASALGMTTAAVRKNKSRVLKRIYRQIEEPLA